MRFYALADVLREEARRIEPHFNVFEVDGWQQRGNEAAFDDGGFVDHHTAGGSTTIAGSLNLVIHGGSNTAPGPLANLFQDHQPGGSAVDNIYVVAAGKANHAGTGGWNGISGNSRAVGIEVEHDGRSPFPDRRRAITLRVGAAVLRAIGSSHEMRCHHWEWSYPPGSKIDVCCNPNGTKCSGDEWRALTADIMRGADQRPPEPEPAPRRPIMEDIGMRMVVGPRQGMVGQVAYVEDGDDLMYEFNGDDVSAFGLLVPRKAAEFLQGTTGITYQQMVPTGNATIDALHSDTMKRIRWRPQPDGTVVDRKPVEIR